MLSSNSNNSKVPKDFILLRLINSYEYSPLKRSAKFAHLLNALSPSKQDKLIDGFARYLSNEIVYQVTNAIKSQKFKVAFKPLSPQYLDYKRRNKLELGFWRSTSFLLNNIKYWKYKDEFRIGWPNHLTYPNSNVKCVFVAKTLEFGTKVRKKDGTWGGTPARPIFFPLVQYISKNIGFFLERYLKKINFKYY